MSRIYNPFLIVTNQSGSSGPSQGLQFVFLSSSYGDLTTSGSLGGITARDISADSTGAIGEIVISAPTSKTSSGVDIMRLSFSDSEKEPRVGIGFESEETILKPFEVKSKVESDKGTEILIRSSRTGSGAQVGDEAGSINFVIDSASFEDITTTGSIARIKTRVNDVSAEEGVDGQLTFAISRNTDVEIDMMDMAYDQEGTYSDFYSTVTSHSIEIKDTQNLSNPAERASFVLSNGINPYVIIRTDNPGTTSLGGLIQLNDKFGTGSIFLHGPTGEITASNIQTDDLIVDNSFQYNNIVLESTESIVSGSDIIIGEFPVDNYKALFIDYLLVSSSNRRAGNLTITFDDQRNFEFTDVSTLDVGDTSDAYFDFAGNLAGSNAELKIYTNGYYTASISSRGILDGTNFALGGGVHSKSPFPFTGSAAITGSFNMTGDIIPNDDGLYDLGDATHFWRTASIEHIVTLGDTIEFRDKNNKGIPRGTLKLDAQGGLKVRGSSDTLTTVSASHGHFTGDMNIAGDLAIRGISNISASIANAASSGGDSSNRLSPNDTGSLVTTGSFNTFTSSIQTEVDILTAATSSYLTSIPSTYFNSSLLTTENISKNFNYTSSLNVVEITSSVEGAIIDYRLTRLDSGSRVGTFMYAHDGTTLSYNDITIPGAGLGDEPTLSATLTGSIVSIDIENAAGFNFSGFAKKFSKLDSAVPVADPNVTYLLDISPSENALAAYSIRKLSQFHTGSAIRVRRASDNVELDIEYDVNGELDTAAIEAHCGTSIGRVTVWYDQSGNNNHISESNASFQPAIWSGTSTYPAGSNNKPALTPAGAFPLTTQNITPEGLTIVTEMGNNYDVLLAGSSYTDKIRTANGMANLIFEGAGNTLSIPFDGGYKGYNLITLNKNTQWGGKTNNNPTVTGTATGDFTVQCLFARLPGGSSSTNDGRSQEFIFWENEQTENQTNLQNNINNYYGIYDTGLLEDYPGAQFAYSVRQLTTAATSSMEIRRASDNTETTIGFALNGNLNTSSIETFCNGTECVVVKWYDQSGNGNDAAQSNSFFQPTIYSGSTVITFNGIPTPTNLYYNYNDKFNITNSLGGVPASGSFTVSYVNNLYNAGGTAFNVISGIADRTNRLITYMPGYAGIDGTYSRSPDHADHAIVYRKSGSEANIQGAYYNGSFTTENNLNGQAAYNPSVWSFPPPTPTYMHEIIFWPTNLSGSGATDIMDNVNSYFNIY